MIEAVVGFSLTWCLYMAIFLGLAVLMAYLCRWILGMDEKRKSK